MRPTMSFNRMPRIQEALPAGKVKLPDPPNLTPPPKLNWFLMFLPLAGVLIMVAVYGGINHNYLLAIPMGVMSLVSMVTSVLGQVFQRKTYQRQVQAAESTYAEVLRQKQSELEQARQQQRRILTQANPDFLTLLTMAQRHDPHLWDRRPADDDFLHIRLGIGQCPSSVIVEAPHPDMPDPRLDPAHQLEAEYAWVPQVPLTGDLRAGPWGIVGRTADRTKVTHSLIAHLIAHHAPDEVHLVVLYALDRAPEWEWVRWLPHTFALDEQAGKQYLANDSSSAREVLKELLEELHRRQNQLQGVQPGAGLPAWPWLVVLVEDGTLAHANPAINLLLSPEGRRLNVTAIFMVDQPRQVPAGCQAILELQPNGELRYAVSGPGGQILTCFPEYVSSEQCDQMARALAPLKVLTLQADDALPTSVRLLTMLNITDLAQYDVQSKWKHRPEGLLQIPIGEQRGGHPLILDLNHTGHGPHGLVAGTTGSGKSELVQTLVVSLALTHHPYDVGFVLVDFKGGGTFSELARLPHTLGMVTDLSGNLTERALIALQAEVDRRKQLFNEAGVIDIGPYQELYWGQPQKYTPLPRLIVIIDEFAELVNDHPDFMDGLIAIARVGRSLGIHLILATQSPAGVVNQQIWANAKFRICLRVEQRQESMEMLHRPEAANLPRLPGRGYLQVGNNDVFELFQVARVASRYRLPSNTETFLPGQSERIVISEVSPLGKRRVLFDSRKQKSEKDKSNPQKKELTDIDMVVQTLQEAAQRLGIEKLPSPWPDPLPTCLPLPELFRQALFAGWNGMTWDFTPRTAVRPTCPHCQRPVRPNAKFCPACGKQLVTATTLMSSSLLPPLPHSPDLPQRPWLGALIGLQDDPAHQRQTRLQINLADMDGQLLVVGAPGSGKEQWVRTLITSLAWTHAPDEIHFYLLEFSGQAMKLFESLPHVGGYFTPSDDERIKRLLRLLLDNLEERKQLCSQWGLDNLIRLRELQPTQAPPALAVIITGFADFRTMFQDEQVQLLRLIREGGPYGIHLILLGDRAGDFPIALTSVISRRVVLRLADPGEYAQVLNVSLKVDKNQMIPVGRGWYGQPPLEFQTALPSQSQDEAAQLSELQELSQQMQNAVALMQQSDPAWSARLPLPVKALPTRIPLQQLLDQIKGPLPAPLTVPLGLDTVRMRPVWVNLVNDGSDFIIAASSQGGKTTLLLTWTLLLAEFHAPQQLQFVIVSGRRGSLQALENLPHKLEYCRNADAFLQSKTMERLNQEISRREQLLTENPTAIQGLPHLIVEIDDYDEFFNAVEKETTIVAGLERLAKRGRDVKLHMWVTGPLPAMGGNFRDPVVKQLKLGRSGFLLRVLDAGDQNPLGIRVRSTDIKQLPPGRGYLVRNGVEEMLQVAEAGDAATIAARIKALRQRWLINDGKVAYPTIATDE